MNDRPGTLTRKKPPSPQRAQSIVFSAIVAFSAVFSVVSCGKKGPPLAPLVRLPAPPADLAAVRRGNTVDLSFTVPAANTDGTRPANVASAEVYALTAPVTEPPLSDADLLKFGVKVGSVPVKAPRDPNLTADADDPADEVEAPQGPGLDQGTLARIREPLTREMLAPAALPADKNAPSESVGAAPDAPLLGPPAAVPVRTYAAFGTSTRGRKGPLSSRVTVPLVPPPPPPAGATITYDEAAMTLTWPPAETTAQAPAGTDVLPSRPIGTARPPIAYNVYDTTVPAAPLRLTAKPLDAPTYSDGRIVWGEKRCYTVVAAESVGGSTIESEPPPPVCETFVDTFPPAAPKEVKAIATEGAINLIWEPNTEKDLAGYIVLRRLELAQTFEPVTPAPIAEPSFKDTAQQGIAYVYAVRAVDKAGNASASSASVVETAR